jgi:hypothetical protein
MGGMFTVVKIRDGITGFDDPGWYHHPPGTVAWAGQGMRTVNVGGDAASKSIEENR